MYISENRKVVFNINAAVEELSLDSLKQLEKFAQQLRRAEEKKRRLEERLEIDSIHTFKSSMEVVNGRITSVETVRRISMPIKKKRKRI